jgi:hypothetical protein
MGHPLVLVLVPVLNVAHAATGGNCRGTIAQGSADRQRAGVARQPPAVSPKSLPSTHPENARSTVVMDAMVAWLERLNPVHDPRTNWLSSRDCRPPLPANPGTHATAGPAALVQDALDG